MENTPRKILVVDDEQAIVDNLSAVLELADYKVASTTSGIEALELAKTFIPDLIILDIVMPDMDGGTVAAKLTQNPITAGIPVIFLTGIVSKDEQLSIEGVSTRYTVAKPITAEELLLILKKVLPDT